MRGSGTKTLRDRCTGYKNRLKKVYFMVNKTIKAFEASLKSDANDKRKRCRAEPPYARMVSKMVTVNLNKADYTLLYEKTMRSGKSMQETLRQMIRS